MDIRSFRIMKGLTLKKLSEEAGISESYLSMIENKERTPSIRVAKKLSDILGINWTDFYEEEPDQSEHERKEQ